MPSKHQKNNSKDAKKSKVAESKKRITAKQNAATTDTVIDIFSLKHPLNDEWSFWYLENDQSKTWEEMQKKMYTFETVEDFWSMYNHIKPPSEISQGNDFSLFKNGIRPMWEDAANKNGGRWVLNVQKNLRRTKLDELWLDTLLCIMAEDFKYCEDVMGAVVNIRHSGDRISIWTSDAKNQKSVMAIGMAIKGYLRLNTDFKFHYEAHSSSKQSKILYNL